MISGYVVIVESNAILPDLPLATDMYRKTAVKIFNRGLEFFITAEGTAYEFEVK